MKTYTLTYARTVILKKEIEAKTITEAWQIAEQLEDAGELGILSVAIEQPNDDSWVASIEDDESIWDIESDDQDDWMY